MFEKLKTFFGYDNVGENAEYNLSADTRRKYVRYPGVQADVKVGDAVYNVRDWSLGGVSFNTVEDSAWEEGDKVNVVMTFRFPHEIITIEQKANVVRTGAWNGTAVSWGALKPEIRRELSRVIDNMHAQDFLESQIA